MIEVLIELFLKFAVFEAEPHFNARASALATVLQNGEAPLRHFGQSQYFPNVGKDCALSPRALCALYRLSVPRNNYVYSRALRSG